MLADIVGGSYKGRYISMNPQRTINWYIQKDQLQDEETKYKQALLCFPGLSLFTDTLKTRARKIYVARTISYTRCFVVANNFLFEIFTDGTNNNIGQMTSIPDDITSIWMECNDNNQVMISNSLASYCFDMSTNILTKITNVNLPGNIDYLSYSEGYILATAGGRVYYNLNDITTWDALNVFTPTSSADKTLAAVVWRDNVHCFGQETIVQYINDGTTPFSKQNQTTLNIGLYVIASLSVFHDGIVFVGMTKKGQYRVFYYNGSECVPVSIPSIEWQLNSPPTIQNQTWDMLTTFTWDSWYDAWGSSVETMYSEIQYSKDGHIFYYLTIPPIRTTFVYDLTTKEWVERQSYSTAGGNVNREFRGTSLVNFSGLDLWTDLYSGKIYKEDFSVSTEDSNTITRIRISQLFSEEKKNISIYEFELDCTTGVGLTTVPATTANINFYYSRDGGNTYSSAVSLSTGVAGDFNIRTRARSIGTARNWVFKLELTDPADIMLQSGIIHGVIDSY